MILNSFGCLLVGIFCSEATLVSKTQGSKNEFSIYVKSLILIFISPLKKSLPQSEYLPFQLLFRTKTKT